MEINELLIPTILGGICVAISVYGLAIAKDRKYALGGLFLYSLIPISHRTGIFLENPEDYFGTNVSGTFNVLQASRDAGVSKFIYTASSSCYGLPDKFPTSELARIQPQYPYALTKWLGEELALHWAKVYQMPVVSLRLFNVYGPRSRTSGTYGAVFGVFLAQKLAGQPFTVVGDGSQTRDFTYVSDVVDAFIVSANSNATEEIFNIGSGATVSIKVIENPLSSLIHQTTESYQRPIPHQSLPG